MSRGDGPGTLNSVTKKVRPYGSSTDIAALELGRRGKEHMSELASTRTVAELAMLAADAIAALNDLTGHDGSGLHGSDLNSAAEVRDVLAGLEVMTHGLPRLCEQLTRFLVTHREDHQASAPAYALDEVTEALTSAAQAADMLTDALDQARQATELYQS